MLPYVYVTTTNERCSWIERYNNWCTIAKTPIPTIEGLIIKMGHKGSMVPALISCHILFQMDIITGRSAEHPHVFFNPERVWTT